MREMNWLTRQLQSTFRSLRCANFRTWSAGSLVSNVGTWMQRTAQDWLVLTQLTKGSATAVGIVMALQFGPQLLMLPLTGYVADHFDRRKLIFFTQAVLGALALGLGVLTVTGLVQLWHVYVFAFLLGCVTAFDAPARQAFVSDMVEDVDLSNAVALSSTSFNAARLIGPAVAGLLITAVGLGWVFLLNAASFGAVLWSLGLLRGSELHHSERPARKPGSLLEGFRYVWRRPELVAVLSMLLVICTLGFNFPIFLSTMSVTVFHGGAAQYGVLSSTMAIGSVTGALLSASRAKPGMAVLITGATLFGLGWLVAAFMPSAVAFAWPLIVIGGAAQTFTTTANATVQLSTEPAMRGRVLAIFLAIALGGTPLGAPLVGWVADRWGAPWALGVAAASGFIAALIGVGALLRAKNARLSSVPRAAGW